MTPYNKLVGKGQNVYLYYTFKVSMNLPEHYI